MNFGELMSCKFEAEYLKKLYQIKHVTSIELQ